MSYVYRHIRLDTNEVFYVGIGSDDNGKYKRAYNKYERSKFWKNVTSKTDYTVEIIIENLTREEACNKEIELIQHYGRRKLNKGSLVNFTLGGTATMGAFCFTKEFKEKMSLINKNKKVSDTTKANMRKASKNRFLNGGITWMKGKKHTEESKIKQSVVKRKFSDLQLIDIKKDLIETGLSVTQVARKYNVSHSVISRIKSGSYPK